VTQLSATVIKGMHHWHIFCIKMTFLSYIYSEKQSCYELGSEVKYTLDIDEGWFQRLATHGSLTLPRNVTEF